MSQKSGNHVKAPAQMSKGAQPGQRNDETITEQYHGNNTKSVQDAKRIGQSQQTGRPPLMKK